MEDGTAVLCNGQAVESSHPKAAFSKRNVSPGRSLRPTTRKLKRSLRWACVNIATSASAPAASPSRAPSCLTSALDTWSRHASGQLGQMAARQVCFESTPNAAQSKARIARSRGSSERQLSASPWSWSCDPELCTSRPVRYKSHSRCTGSLTTVTNTPTEKSPLTAAW